MTQALRQGLKSARGARSPDTEFRSSMTTPEGLHKTDIFQGRVINVNFENWTVDVFSQFDQIRCLEIPVASPYQHSNRGEGMYVMPEVGAKCVVCWPGDTSPPFLLAFIMPHETDLDRGTEEDPTGSQSRSDSGKTASTASFAGGRPKAKGGDIMMRGRDGNFITLHRGGVLQIGSNELSQRVYIPLNNLIMDFCENYALHNAGGSVTWGIQEGVGQQNLPAHHTEVFRVFANDKYADIRIIAGKVHTPVPDSVQQSDLSQLGIGTDAPIVYEFAFAQNGFRGDDGGLINTTGNQVKLRFLFDRKGNVAFRIDGNVLITCRKRLRLRVQEGIDVFGESLDARFDGDVKIKAGGSFEVIGDVFRINSGSKIAACVGDTVTVALPPGLLIAIPGPPGFAPLPPPLGVCSGTVVGPGSPTVRYP